METEYMAMNLCTIEAIWLKQLMEDLDCVQKEATTIMCDNQGSMALAKNPTNHYQPKATTLTCVLVRMAALVLILEFSLPNHFSFLELSTSRRQPVFNEYYTPYVCSRPRYPFYN